MVYINKCCICTEQLFSGKCHSLAPRFHRAYVQEGTNATVLLPVVQPSANWMAAMLKFAKMAAPLG